MRFYQLKEAMKSFLHIICILGFISSLLGQPLSNKFILFDAIIITNEGKIDHRVNLFQLSDSAIIITNASLKKSELLNHDFGSNRMIRIENIKTIKIRRKGAIRRGFTMGAMTGVLIPVYYSIETIGDEDHMPANEYIFFTVSTVTVATLIGGAIGSKHAYYPIEHDYVNFQKFRAELERFTIVDNYLLE